MQYVPIITILGLIAVQSRIPNAWNFPKIQEFGFVGGCVVAHLQPVCPAPARRAHVRMHARTYARDGWAICQAVGYPGEWAGGQIGTLVSKPSSYLSARTSLILKHGSLNKVGGMVAATCVRGVWMSPR